MIYAVAFLAPGKAKPEWKSFTSALEALAFVQARLAAGCHVTVECDGQKLMVGELARVAQAI